MSTAAASWRSALPRVRISATSELPVAALAALLASAGERIAALEAYREALDAAPDHLEVLVALGALLARLGREDEEVAIRKRIAVLVVAAMGLAPEHHAAAVAFELATLGIGATPPEMPAGYTAALFDGYAARFDQSLRGELHYRAPELVHEGLSRALAERFVPSSAPSWEARISPSADPRALGRPGTPAGATLDICDVGCGTGLLGALLRPLARRLDGVDRSPRMLDEARALGLYDDLAEADLTAALASRPGAYDVVTAADVLVYIGDLAPALAAAASALRAGGLLAFTVEQTGEDGYHLTAAGRYEHAPSFVREAAAAAGLTEVSVGEVTLRMEQSHPVSGLVWVLCKGAAARPGIPPSRPADH
jgi:predicted TPR repeat methyltransferase